MKIKIKLLPGAIMPAYSTNGAAALDLYASQDAVKSTSGVLRIATGVCLEIPPGYVGLIKARSGHAATYGLEILGGVIDPDYRGEIIVLAAANPWLERLERPIAGERIAQLLILPALRVELEQGELSPTERGEKAFGSTGR